MSDLTRDFFQIPPKDYVKITDDKDIIQRTNDLIDGVNKNQKKTSLQSSFDCDIISVTIPNGESLKIRHRLKIVPKYRLILRQSGGGVITDINSGWTKNYIELFNDGATDAVITVGVYKE
jgi:hypothetical protein